MKKFCQSIRKINLYLLLIAAIIFSARFSLHSQIIPFGGENGVFWQQNTSQYILWDTSFFTNNVNIFIWNRDSSQYFSIANEVDYNLGYYNWNIPSDYPTGNNFRIKIVQVNDSSVFLISPTFFPIYESNTYYKKRIEEKTEPKPVSFLYPNPASDYINLPAYLGWQYQIYDLLGNCVQRGVIDSESINVWALSTGFYTIRIYKESKQFVGKVMKQ